jgi:hypothetical protein
MSEEATADGKSAKPKKLRTTPKKEPEKPHIISDIERERLKLIAEKVQKMRIAKKMSYEQFAIQSEINRNSYFRLEQAAKSGDNYTVALLLKVIRGLGSTPSKFFGDIQ